MPKVIMPIETMPNYTQNIEHSNNFNSAAQSSASCKKMELPIKYRVRANNTLTTLTGQSTNSEGDDHTPHIIHTEDTTLMENHNLESNTIHTTHTGKNIFSKYLTMNFFNFFFSKYLTINISLFFLRQLTRITGTPIITKIWGQLRGTKYRGAHCTITTTQ
jgi:hypothetical protein